MNALTRPYALAARFALACPILFAVPAVMEAIQHVVEYRAGFYDSVAAMKAAEWDGWRMALGHLKVCALFLTGYWATRFWAFGDDPRAARRIDPNALLLFVPVMAWGLFWLVVVQDGPILAAALGVPARAVAVTIAVLLPVTMAFEVCLAAWKVAAPIGDARVGFVRSVRLTRGSYFWALGVTLATVLPWLAAHYALAFAALGRGGAAMAAILFVDSVLVAAMAPLMVAVNYAIARRVTGRAGIDLSPAVAVARGVAA